jgi:hypothetical protein
MCNGTASNDGKVRTIVAFGIVHQRHFTCRAYHSYILPLNGSEWASGRIHGWKELRVNGILQSLFLRFW